MKLLEQKSFSYPSYHRRENDTYCDMTIWVDSNETKAIVMFIERINNQGTSITNRYEKLQELFTERYKDLILKVGFNNITWLEHYLPGSKSYLSSYDKDRYAIVTRPNKYLEWERISIEKFRELTSQSNSIEY